MSVDMELPDPASIWKELGEFQGAVDSYVKQQTDLADRLRRTHIEFCQDQRAKLDSVEAQKKRAEHDYEILQEEKQKEREELDRMRKKSNALQRDASELPAKVEQQKAKDEEQQHITSVTRMKVDKNSRIHKLQVEEKKSELVAYQRALGLNIRKDIDSNLHFAFTHVDDAELDAQFSFAIRIEDEMSQTVSLVSCVPPLEAAPSFIECYNKSKHPAKLSTLVRIFRREFQKSLEARPSHS